MKNEFQLETETAEELADDINISQLPPSFKSLAEEVRARSQKPND